MRRSFFIQPTLVLLAWLASAATVQAAPQVVVSLKPLHSLVANIMEGVGTPTLLVKQGSPHGYALRPSEARALHQADMVIWVGPELESFLEKPLKSIHGQEVQIAAAIPDLLLPARAGGHWHEHDEEVSSKPDREFDPHLWLGLAQAKQISALTVSALCERDPANQAHYQANGAKLQQRLDALQDELTRLLAPVSDIPYIVFHDAYQYFEASFGLNAVSSVTIDPERRPGIRRIMEIRDHIKELGARCVFTEPQFEPRLVATITEGTRVNTGTLDPLGAEIPAGPDAYFVLMRSLGNGIVAGLTETP